MNSTETNRIDVGHVAELARIAVSEAERAALQHDMEKIVAYIEQLSELDVTGIEPTAHAAALVNVAGEDLPREPFGRKTMLADAPALTPDETIRVPRVLPGEGSN